MSHPRPLPVYNSGDFAIWKGTFTLVLISKVEWNTDLNMFLYYHWSEYQTHSIYGGSVESQLIKPCIV